MKINVTIFLTFLFLGLAFLLFRASGYEFPDKNKHAEIPFFPATTNKDFVNHQVDSMYVESYQELKESNLLLINYDINKRDDQSSSIAIVTKSFKPIFHLKTTDYLYTSFNDTLNTLFIIQQKKGVNKGTAFNLNTRKSAVISLINEKNFNALQTNLAIAKHFTSNGGATESIFFINNKGDIYLANGEAATEISKRVSLKESDNFNFAVPIVFNGDSSIHSKNIQLFDNVVVANQWKRFFVVGTPSSNGGTGEPSKHKDKGWFDKSRHYFFNIKVGEHVGQFKTPLFYNSFTYFDELTDPKTANDTLMYYTDNRFYQFYKKQN